MGKQSFKEAIKDCIAYISFKIFLWSIGMTREKYWYEIYKAERSRMCINNPTH